jgi:NTP pyrophosphatase (non-canonical NTP hydrolase)
MAKIVRLTQAENERIALLLEECGEVIQICGKILRHGYESYHPDSPDISNRTLLEKELGDVTAAIELMISSKDIDKTRLKSNRLKKLVDVEKWLHFNRPPIDFIYVEKVLKHFGYNWPRLNEGKSVDGVAVRSPNWKGISDCEEFVPVMLQCGKWIDPCAMSQMIVGDGWWYIVTKQEYDDYMRNAE